MWYLESKVEMAIIGAGKFKKRKERVEEARGWKGREEKGRGRKKRGESENKRRNRKPLAI